MPANFRTYEGQSRLLTAVIAAHPGLKLNYKEIATHYGSDWSESGIEHFFRPVKKNAKAIQAIVKRHEDPADFNYQLYFGESTPDGIQFQFRQIKRDAENMRQGKEAAVPPSSATSTPAKTPKTPKTPGGRGGKRAAPSSNTGKSASATPASKRVKREISDEETLATLDSDDFELLANAGSGASALNQTPTKSRGLHHHEPPPALDLTQATSPEDDDATLTPHEDATYSFAQANSQPSALASDPWAAYNNNAAAAGSGQQYLSSFVKNDYEDDGEV